MTDEQTQPDDDDGMRTEGESKRWSDDSPGFALPAPASAPEPEPAEKPEPAEAAEADGLSHAG